MAALPPGWLGIILLLAGSVLAAGAWLAARPLASRLHRRSGPPHPPPLHIDIEPSEHAVIVARPGGRVVYVNARARAWFGLDGEAPDLHRLAQAVRPRDLFLELFADEGRARLSIAERAVEAVSNRVPLSAEPALVITLEPLQAEAPGKAGGLGDLLTIDSLLNFSQAITDRGTVGETAQAILDSLPGLLPTDMIELNLWDELSQTLKPFRAASARRSQFAGPSLPEVYRVGEGFTGWLAVHRQALFVPDMDQARDIEPKVDRARFPFQAYLGVPLQFGSTFIGSLEIAHSLAHTYDQRHRMLLELMGAQAAAALHNAGLYESHQRSRRELVGLSQLAHALTAASTGGELYEHLGGTVARLLEADVAGFLSYSSPRSALIGQTPFVGLSPEFVERRLRLPAGAGSATERWLHAGGPLDAANPLDDRLVQSMDLDEAVSAGGWGHLILAPVRSSGKPLGAVLAAWPEGQPHPGPEAANLVSILAAQSAALIENAQLLQAAQRRAEQADSLRRVSGLSARSGTLDENLIAAMDELVASLELDFAVLLLADEAGPALRPHGPSAHGLELDELILAAAPALSAPRASGPRAVYALTPVVYDQARDAEPPAVYRDLIAKKQAGSLAAIPIISRQQALGELLIGQARTGGLSRPEIDLATAFAGQLAGSLRQARLAEQTDASLRQRVDQLSAVTRLSQALASQTDLGALLLTVHSEAVRATGADCGWTVLFPSAEGGQPQVLGASAEHPAPELDLLREWAEAPVPHIDDRPAANDPAIHNGLNSALVIPIRHHDRPAGLIHLHSRQPGHFDDASLRFAEGLASQVAAAMDTADLRLEQEHLVQATRRRSEGLNRLLQITQSFRPDQPLEVTLDGLARFLAETAGLSRVQVFTLSAQGQELRPAAQAPASAGDSPFPDSDWAQVEPRLKTAEQVGLVHWLPGEPRGLVPLIDRARQPMGLIVLDAAPDRAGQDLPAEAPLDAVVRQIVAAMESTGLYRQMRAGQHGLEQTLSELRAEHDSLQRTSRQLAESDQQAQAEAKDLAAQARRILAVDRIARAASAQDDRMGILGALARGCREEFMADVVLIAQTEQSDVTLSLAEGELSESLHFEPLFSQFNPLRTAALSNQAVLIERLPDDHNWGASPLLRALGAYSATAVPIPRSDAPSAAILLVRRDPAAPSFSQADVDALIDLMPAIGRDLSRGQLLETIETRLAEGQLLLEFGQHVGSLDARQVLNHLADGLRRSMPATQAAALCLWDPEIHGLRVAALSGYLLPEALLDLRLQPGEGLPGKVYAAGASIIWDDVHPGQDLNYSVDHLESYHRATGGLLPASALGVPLATEAGVLGTITLENYASPHSFTEADAAFVTSLASQAALTVQNARLFEQAQRASQELEQRVAERTEELAREHELTEALLRITAELASSLDLDRVLNRALSLVNEVVGADRGVILLMAPDSDQLVLRAAIGPEHPLPPGGRPSPYVKGQGLAGWVIERGEPVLIEDLPQDPRWVRYRDPVEEHRSALAVPLLVSQDLIGAMMLFSSQAYAFDADQLRLLSAAGHQVAAAVNNAELYRLIRDQAERLGSLLREQQIEASKSRAILESIADGVIVTDADHQVVLFNASAERILRLDRQAVVDQAAVDFIGVYGAAGRRWVEAVQAWRSQAKPGSARDDVLDERLELDDDRIVAVSVAPVVLGQEFLGTVSIFRDITREVEVDQLKSEFVATVSHELRTPMTSVKGYVEMLLMGAVGGINDEQRRFLQIIKGNIDRLGGLVNDLLDISRIESGRVTLDLEQVDLGDMLAEVREVMLRRGRIESKPLDIELELPEALPPAWADRDRLRQIINNLVENSFNYTPAGGRIDLRATAEDGWIEVQVADNGIGILPVDLPKVFERFYRGQQALNLSVAGTGLGLSIVRQLIDMHGGEIRIQSQGIPGQGTVCTIRLPAAPPSEPGRPA